MDSEERGQWAVIGVGSMLRGDDGMGPRLAEELRGDVEARGGQAIDGGTGGLGLADLMCRFDHVLFLDAARMGLAPGEARRIKPEELKPGAGLSGHEADLPAAIQAALHARRFVRTEPRLCVDVIGVEPASTAPGLELSGAIAAQWGKVVDEVRRLTREWIDTLLRESKTMITTKDLAKVDFLKGLTEEDLAALVGHARRVQVPQGQVFHKEGESAEELFFLEKGRIAIEIEVGSGRKTTVFTVAPGEPFSWSAIVPPHILTASLVAVEPSEVLCVSGKALLDMFDKNPRLARVVLEHASRLISTRLKDTRLQLINLLQWQVGAAKASD